MTDDSPSPQPSTSEHNDKQHQDGNIGNGSDASSIDQAREDSSVIENDPSKRQQAKIQEGGEEELPIEYQLYEVDLTNPDMDPLEYAFRRYVPIPKEYFWDTATEANEYKVNLPLRVKLWHNSIYYLGECLKKAEAGGEVIANFLGLNSGPFDYVTEGMTEEEMARSRANLEMRREEQVEMERRKEGFV